MLSLSSKNVPYSPSASFVASSGSFQYFNILFILWKPNLHIILKVRTHQCPKHTDSLWLDDCAVFNAPQNAFCVPEFQNTLLSPISPIVLLLTCCPATDLPVCVCILQNMTFYFVTNTVYFTYILLEYIRSSF